MSPVLRSAKGNILVNNLKNLVDDFWIPVSSKSTLQMSSYWEGKPPSSVLGIGAGIPSAIFAPLSIAAFIAGTYCIHESNILNQITATTINPIYIAGSALVPISWGAHVAAWIQKENGK